MVFEMFTNNKSVDYNLGALFVFRGAAKTTFLKGAVAYAVDFNIWDNIQYRGVTLEKVRSDFFDDLKEMFREPLHISVFGEMLIENKRHKSAKTQANMVVFNNKAHTRVSIKGAEQSSRGALKKRRLGWAIGDDIESQDNTKTEEARDLLYKKIWGEDIPACRADRSMFTYASTPHPDGIYFRLKAHKNVKRVEHWLYKQDKDGRWLLDQNGNRIPTWPELYPLATCILKEQNYLEDTKLGRSLFNQEFLGILTSDIDRAVPEHLIQYRLYDTEFKFGKRWAIIREENRCKIDFPVYRPIFSVLAVDPGASLNPGACDTAGIVVDFMPNYNVMVRDSWAGKYRQRDILKFDGSAKYDEVEMDFAKVAQEGAIGKTFRKIYEHRPNMVVIEVVGGFEHIWQEFDIIRSKYFLKRFPDHYFQMVKYNPITDDRQKIDRIAQVLQSIFETRNGYINGEFKPIRDHQGNVVSFQKPQNQLIEQMINLGSMKLKDLADIFATAREHAQWPQDEDYTNVLKRYNRREEDDDEPVESLAQTFRERAWA